MNTSNPYGGTQGTNNSDSSLDPTLSGNINSSQPTNPQMTSSPDLTSPMQNQNVVPNDIPEEMTRTVQSVPTQNPLVEQRPAIQENPVQNTNSVQQTNPITSYAPQNTPQETNTNLAMNTSISSPVLNENPQTPLPNTDVTPKKGLPKFMKILIIVVLVFVVLATLSVAVFGAKYLQENHVPLVSGLTESILLSEGEQFSTRVEYLVDLGMYKALTMDNTPFKPDFDPQDIKPIGADKIIEEVETAEQINYDTSLSLQYTLAESLQPVLGLKDPGEINEDSINKILSSREGKITFTSQDSVQFNNQDRARNITNVEFEVPGVNLNTGFETRILDKLIYFNLDRFPRNDYVKVEEIEGKWFMLDPETLAKEAGVEANLYNPEELLEEFGSQDQTELKKEDYDKVIQLINSPAVQKSITNSFDEKVSETNARCYVMSLTKENIINIYKEAGKLYDENFSEEEYDQMNDLEFPMKKSELTLCFAKLESYPVKVAYDFEIEESGNNVKGLFEFKMTGMKMVTPIETPENPTTLTLMDLQGLLKEDALNLVEPSYEDPDYNYDEDYDYDDYTSEDYYTQSNVCEYLSFYKVCDLCTNNSPDCQVCLDDYNDFVENGSPMSIEMRNKCL